MGIFSGLQLGRGLINGPEVEDWGVEVLWRVGERGRLGEIDGGDRRNDWGCICSFWGSEVLYGGIRKLKGFIVGDGKSGWKI